MAESLPLSVGLELISFDLDGTLVDTAAEIAEAANRTLQAQGLARRPQADITLLIGAGTRELMRRLLAVCAIDEPAAAALDIAKVFESFDIHYATTTGTSARPYAGCADALTELRCAGIRLACVTNKEIRHAQRVLEATGLTSYFDLVVGGDSLATKKPHPGVLRYVARSFGVAPARMVHVGDSAVDVEAARNAGVAAWAVPYGYNAGRPIADARPDRVFDSLPELAAFVLGALPAGAKLTRLPRL